MITYYNFRKKLYGGVWEIKSKIPYIAISEGHFDTENLKLLDSPFWICHGKKQRDIIYYYGDISIEFLSQNIYSFLSFYCNLEKYLYPIEILNYKGVYYFINDLPEFQFINRNVFIPNTNFEIEIPCFLLQDDICPFFTLNNTRFKIITPEMKIAMEKAKLTNVAFDPIFGVNSMDEYYELQRNNKLRRNQLILS